MHEPIMCVTWLIHICDVTLSYVKDVPPYGRDMAHSYVLHDFFVTRDSITCVTWLIHACNVKTLICNMTHWYVWCDSFTCLMRLFHMWHDSLICVTQLFDMCDMTVSHVTQLIHMCDMTHPYVWRDSFTCVSHESFICATWPIHMYETTLSFTGMTWLFHMCDMTHLWVEKPDVVEVEFLEAWRDAILSKTLWHGICACIEIKTGCVYVNVKERQGVCMWM